MPAEKHDYTPAPVPPEAIKTREDDSGRILSYIDARTAQELLDQTFGRGGWESDFKLLFAELDDKHAIVSAQCTISAYVGDRVLRRTDSGSHSIYRGKTISDHAWATLTGDAFKAAYSDAFKRAAVQFGIGRELYGSMEQAESRQRLASARQRPDAARTQERRQEQGDRLSFRERIELPNIDGLPGTVYYDENGQPFIVCPDHGVSWAMNWDNGEAMKCKRRASGGGYCSFRAAKVGDIEPGESYIDFINRTIEALQDDTVIDKLFDFASAHEIDIEDGDLERIMEELVSALMKSPRLVIEDARREA